MNPQNIKFSQDDSDKLLKLLTSSKALSDQDAEKLGYSLIEIRESINKIYSEVIPDLLNQSSVNIEIIKDKLWDIREEFRHIMYHISDGNLADL